MSGIKVLVDGKWHDADKEPIFFVFQDDESRKMAASHLTNMQQKSGVCQTMYHRNKQAKIILKILPKGRGRA